MRSHRSIFSLRTTRCTLVLLCLTVMMLLSSPAFAAGGGDHGFPWVYWGASMFNFLVFIGILYKLAWPKIQAFFATRQKDLMADIEEARRLKEAAELKVQEYEARLNALDDERATMLAEYEDQGKAARKKIIEDAKRQVAKMRVDAKNQIDQDVKKAIATLEQKAVDEALRMAQSTIEQRLDLTQQDALVTEYIQELGQSAHVA